MARQELCLTFNVVKDMRLPMTALEQYRTDALLASEEDRLRSGELRSDRLLRTVERERAARSYLLHVQRQHEAMALDPHTAGR